MSNLSWDSYFLKMANLVAEKSKDKSTKVGCVIVGPNNEVRSTGYNGFPRGVDDDKLERHERPLKYMWTEHAERNTIYNAARNGISLDGCVMYVNYLPCCDCARAIIQAGIKKVISDKAIVSPKWEDSNGIAIEMLSEAGIKVTINIDNGDSKNGNY